MSVKKLLSSAGSLVTAQIRRTQEAEKARAAYDARAAKISSAADLRWPPYRFARITPIARLHTGAESLNYREDLWDYWERMLSDYPEAPKDETERKSRERQFWQMWLNRYVTSSNSLRPKQVILDDWWSQEKWISRYYYAATGMDLGCYHDAEFVRIIEFRVEVPESRPGMADYDKLLEKRKTYRLEWGEWFFMNIEAAFKESFGQSEGREVASQKAHGDARLATEGEAVRGGAGPQKGSSIHDQEF